LPSGDIRARQSILAVTSLQSLTLSSTSRLQCSPSVNPLGKRNNFAERRRVCALGKPTNFAERAFITALGESSNFAERAFITALGESLPLPSAMAIALGKAGNLPVQSRCLFPALPSAMVMALGKAHLRRALWSFALGKPTENSFFYFYFPIHLIKQ
jgi:hypothetical protein